MSDIYGKTVNQTNTSFATSDTMVLKVGSHENAEEFLVQNIAIQYNQALNRIYEIGTSNVYFAPGRTIGSMQIGRIIGKKKITEILGKEGEGVWNPNDTNKQNVANRTIQFYHKGDNTPAFTIKGAIVESYSVQTNAQGMLIYENVSLQFASLEFETKK